MKIPYGKQFLDDSDIESVLVALKSDWLTCGSRVKDFEEKFAKYVGAKYAVAVSNGTAALHVACLAAELKSGDELITSPITFVASANCALYCGAKSVFADITSNYSGLISPEDISNKITSKTKIIIPVHYGGLPCDMEEINNVAKENNLIVIEDACHALGAKYKGHMIGNCSFSDMCVFSFHPVKHITTGEGGMITTNSEELYKKLLLFRTHGISKNETEFLKTSDGPWYYEMQELGYNYRITDFQCALGSSQLDKIDIFLKRRRDIAKKYDTFINSNLDLFEFTKLDANKENAYHLYVLKLKDDSRRKELFKFLLSNDIVPQVHYVPVHKQPFYSKHFGDIVLTESEKFYNKIISLPMYYSLSDEEQDRVIEIIKKFYKKN
ncbi:UDP-4-amino-4,6-dideoxy-N-acetyl-beta-L-altrosamine transaminase [Candidatus Woesearchaeota archaeon]|nr:UDP-4-amino-4,6-dideoxy-N-acetyl-beta-L-altrosamine transaminase [Candidatus Woesearchaeota archaeon]